MKPHLNDQADIDFNQVYSISNDAFYTLPELIQADYKGIRKGGGKIMKVDEEFKEAAETTNQKLLPYIKVWDVESNDSQHRYYFNIPPTCFNHKIKEFQLPKNFQAVSVHLSQYEYNQVSNFNQNQLNQIYETGTFEVPSAKFPIPYVWQISSWVIKGRENIQNSYYQDMGRSYKGYRTWKAYISKDRDDLGRNISLRSGLYNIAIRPVVIFSIFFGFKEMYSYVNEKNILDKLEAKRQIELLKIQDINMELYNHLRMINKQRDKNKDACGRHSKLIGFAGLFDAEISGLKLQMQNLFDLQNEKQQLLATEDEEKEEFDQNLREQINQLSSDFVAKYKIFIDKNIDINTQINQAIYGAQKQYWERSPFNKAIVNQIISLGDCLRIYKYYYDIYQAQMRDAINNFQKQLIENHKIKSKFYPFIEEKTKEYKLGLKKQLKQQFIKHMFEELKQLNLKEIQLYEHYENCKQLIKENLKIEKAEEKQRNKDPSIELVVSKQLFPPYEVYQDDRGHYQLRRQKHYYVNSSKFGWKIKLMAVRYYVWTVNIIFWLLANIISGPMGIRALVSLQKFQPDVTVDSKTGVVKPSHYTVTPVIYNFLSVLEGMKNSRMYFESTADTGLFGKSFYRLFNLIEVYIFRFLLLGVIITLILKPAIIIFNVLISIVMAITAWLWIPVTIVLRVLINSLIYDTDVFRRREKDIIWRSPNCFPLIINLADFLILGVLNSLYCLFKLIIWHPLLISFVTLFAYLRFYVRSTYDFFTLQIIRLLGRVPASQTNVAWKVSGPGISRQYFYGIGLPQVLILVQGNIEATILNQYQANLRKLIFAPSQEVRQKIANYFTYFNAIYNFNDPACSYLSDQLDKQINERRQNFPRISHQIRFTQEELLFILKQVKQFIKSQIQLKDMFSYIWDSYNAKKGDYNQLTETIMSQIFGSSVLQPFEDIEMRFQLNVEQNFNFLKKVDKALDGQILFQLPDEYSIKQKENNQENQQVQKQFIHYQQVIDGVWNAQGVEQNWNSLSSKNNRFYVNFSIAH